tara:strand:+ start:20 stop:298 length:279 start_codon:yes stop_codon:yes gene_type:complete
MKEKIFPILKNSFLVVFLIWIGLLLRAINVNLSTQSYFTKSQLFCAKYITQTALYKNPNGKDLAKFAGIPDNPTSLANFCKQIQIFSGSSKY